MRAKIISDGHRLRGIDAGLIAGQYVARAGARGVDVMMGEPACVGGNLEAEQLGCVDRHDFPAEDAGVTGLAGRIASRHRRYLER